MKISTDEKANIGLQKELQATRSIILDAAEQVELPARFQAIPHEHLPAMIITDTLTGNRATVPLFAYGEVRAAMTAFFSA